jgi:hypothetical protein
VRGDLNQCRASSRTVLTVRNSYVSVKNSYDVIGTVTVDLPNIDIIGEKTKNRLVTRRKFQ